MVKWCLWSALPHICITSAFIQNKTCFPVPVGILSSKLLLWLLSFHNSYSLPSSLLLFWYSLVYFLQWMATRGLRWSPCTPHWSSALRAHRLRWAQPWRRPWGPLKTLCSHPSPKSRTESPDQARSQPGIFLFSFFGLLSKWRNLEGVFSTRLDSCTSKVHGCELYGDMKQPTVNSDIEAASDRTIDPDLHAHFHMLFMWADNGPAPNPPAFTLI